MALCPRLRTLDLRGCGGYFTFYWDRSMLWPASLTSVTVMECGMMNLDLVRVPSLRSFRYAGSFRKAPFYLPATLADLYICFYPVSIVSSAFLECIEYSNNSSIHNSDETKALPSDLPGLTGLTICSNTLKGSSFLSHDGATAQLPLSNLPSLRELQLLMSEMEAVNLADIYVFFKTCQCPNLERLFVQLPAFIHEPMERSFDEAVESSLLEHGFDNLVMVKIKNFSRRRVEVQLVILLLRKASSLHKLLLVSPNMPPPNVPGIKDADLLLLHEGLVKGKILLKESDDGATQPFHSEAFLEI